MEAIVAATLLAIGVLSSVPAQAHYEGYPGWARVAFEAHG